ncbi:hypothetical protein BWQ92_15190 [Arthrobacter sp. QXT-31]|nr:hypothetical protein BWQ92_15190 [Arthrobacter sp. QXT-31]
MSGVAEAWEHTVMPASLRVPAEEQRGQLLGFLETPHSGWTPGGPDQDEYRERFARYLDQLDPSGLKGAFAQTFSHVDEHSYGIAERYYEPFGLPAGLAHMPKPVELALYVFASLAPLDWSAEELNWMLSKAPYSRYIYPSWRRAFHQPISSLEPAERRTIPRATRRMQGMLLKELKCGLIDYRDVRAFSELLLDDGRKDGRIPLQYVSGGDDVGPQVREAVRPIMPEYRCARLFLFMSELTGPKPTAKWKRAAHARIAEEPETLQVAQALLGLAAERTPTADRGKISSLSPYTGAIMRGSVWLLALQPGAPAHISLIGDAAAYLGAGHNGRNGESRSSTAANAAIEALLEIAGNFEAATTDVVGALTRIRDVVKNRNLHKRLVKVIDQLSAERGVSPSELLETAVPDLGLDREGAKTLPAGAHTARIALTLEAGAPTVALTWLTDEGESEPVPAALRNTPELAAVKRAVSEAKKALAIQGRRIERLMASDRQWTGADFRARYLEHPVVGAVAQGLLWTIITEEGGFSGYPRRAQASTVWELVGAEGDTRGIAGDAVVVLWKPWERTAGEVRSWRSHLVEHRLRQPFRQVYRELYLLTPAERETGQYSNRFAAHILANPQVHALAKERGWHGAQLGAWDGGQDTKLYLEFPDERLRAGFSIELVEPEEGLASLCSTNRVWFERRVAADTWDNIALADVPRAVFSEAMRDVDLFTAVAAIGPDPDWVDHPNGHVRDYWGTSHTAELSESARTRHEYLGGLLPRTVLADRCQLTERHLIVRGTHRSYKIHLGSGNILMEPDDSYLCIVKAPGARADRIFLPFEEKAGRLATILSKAFMLMDDHKIKDESILRQIHGNR